MTCKDCIGYKFCSRGRNGQTNFYGKDVACNNVDILCNDFKDKVDFVDVVRCEDCKHYCLSDFRKPNEPRWCERSREQNEYPEPNDFCSYGERRAEE